MNTVNEKKNINQEVLKTKMKTIFYNLDVKNNICADCGKKKSMDYASINNGIIICSECAKEHEKLGYNISFLRPLGDKWDDYLFNYVKTGGNSRFIQFCKDYKVDKGNNNIIQKYKSKGLTYYRDIIRSEVLGYDPPDNINVNKAYEEETEIPDNYPEFKKYSFVKHVDMNYLEKNFYKKVEEKPEEDESIFGKLEGLWGNVKKKIGNEAEDLMKKVSDIDYSGVKEKGVSMFGYFFGSENTEKNDNDNKETKYKEKEKDNDNDNEKKDWNLFKNIFGVEKVNNKIINIENKPEEIIVNKKNMEEEKNLQNQINKNEINDKKENTIQEEEKEYKKDNMENNEIEKICQDNDKKEIKKDNKTGVIEIKEKKDDKYEDNKEEVNNNEIKEKTVETKIRDEEKNLKIENNLDNKYIEIEDKKDKENNDVIEKNINEEIIDKEKNEDIEEILKNNNFNNDSSKMNNEEKDELEKMLQE